MEEQESSINPIIASNFPLQLSPLCYKRRKKKDGDPNVNIDGRETQGRELTAATLTALKAREASISHTSGHNDRTG